MTTINYPKMSKTVSNAIQKYVGQASRTNNARGVAIDALFADGWKSTDLLSPKSGNSTATVEGYQWARDQIVLGFTTDVQALLGRESTKGLNEKSVKKRKYWQQQIGARLNDLRNALVKRETVAAGGGEAGTARTFYMIVDDQLTTWEKRVPNEIVDADLAKDIVVEMRKVQSLIRKAAKKAS